MARANQAIQTLEKYVSVLERVVSNLNLLEFQDLVTLFDAATAIQRTEMAMRIVEEIERLIKNGRIKEEPKVYLSFLKDILNRTKSRINITDYEFVCCFRLRFL